MLLLPIVIKFICCLVNESLTTSISANCDRLPRHVSHVLSPSSSKSEQYIKPYFIKQTFIGVNINILIRLLYIFWLSFTMMLNLPLVIGFQFSGTILESTVIFFEIRVVHNAYLHQFFEVCNEAISQGMKCRKFVLLTVLLSRSTKKSSE